MLSPITNDEIEFLENFYDCTAMTECLIPENLNIPQMWPNCKNVTIRNYQFAMQNYSYTIADDPELSIEEIFKLKKASGDLYSIGSRNTGKSFFLIIDVVLAFINNCKEGCVTSISSEKLVKVTNPICKFIEAHPFLKIFHLKKETTRAQTVKRDPLTLNGEHGAIILNVNEKSGEENPGVQFQGKHYDIRWSEEYSYSTKEGQEQAEDAEMSYGHIERPSGIPDLHVDSPLGKILNDKKLKQWLWKLPQMVREDWNDELEERKAKFYGGKLSPAYKLNVEAETLEGAFNFFDMGRLKDASYYKTGRIKTFEVGKESYEGFENIIHVEKLSGSEQCFITADIGTGSAPSEIIIIFYDGKHYKYTYNITLNRLLQHEQAEIFYWLYEQVGGAFIATDSTHDSGVIIEMLRKKGIDDEHLLNVKFNENIEVDFDRDKEGNILLDGNNNPIMLQANTEAWSFSELEKIFYDGEYKMPPDAKFEEQISNIFSKRSKVKTLYASRGPNHLVQAFQVFGICRFFNRFNVLKQQHTKVKRAWCA
ncbi:MAG: hypothetical protein DRN27_08210 [Thermoplasmata archaeon]|nr:MAG: hypothetical protein DRN27_08210 [Thermoplasmata archaeon]